MYHTKTLSELSAMLEAGEVTSVQLTEHFLQRIKDHDAELNSFITVTAEQALESATAADEKRKSGNAGPLTGIPFAHKDIFCTKGVKTTCGSKMLDNFESPYDATVVEKMQQAGVIMLGKTNMDEFAMGSSNETSYFGPVKNPWNTKAVPGGSSGGSASSVAARLTPAATGTDTGGSIRQPASLCGITGLKPTYGRVSRYGMIAFASSLDQAGPMAQSAEDCALLLNAMSGFDTRDSTSLEKDVPDYTADLNKPLDGLKIGLPKEYFGEGLSEGTNEIVQKAIEEYKAMGAEIIDISLPNTHLAVPVYYVVAPAECSSNLSRFDGVRFGHRCEEPKDLEDLYKRSRGEGFGEEVKRRILVGTYALSAGYYDAYYIKAQQLRRMISDDFTKAFEKVDVIMGPASPETAFNIGEKSDDPISMYLSDIYTIAVNLAGLPGMSVPAGFSNKMPVGLQIIANHFDESRLLNVAHQYQQQTDWHTQIPEEFK
ncbi:MAG: Asp-tRNA(Asn)/Glu-tRNA(Gln) amidotransferase GatCAB subunit A [endosymbiont of Galathealinum brachiosum]|uniref:Glutamyl-tRNA(Gln) amidotransferase subunit A n=1 Tax=endosymbiont of Galathealinum brachiosum TaxID=2200906 RepID=A0A370DDP7_9GAMM|nr:MAG: Asp-tRNA(Asn)/Glu-tRNA(Gln) amidotransferase GatCAB subunit A [endosymbiont of Galathealinum brachiosum]